MATTTPNFGWPVPTSTDLVKDGATAIEALGDGVDASMVDLKGGLTGQVLAKTTNADMDFTWVTTDDTNAIQNAIVDAKGDLISATANDTPARLAVGSNGETLVADSTTSTGLRYQAPVQQNPILNSAMQVWQRGTSMAGSSTGFAGDRWQAYRSVAGSTYSRQLTNDTTNLPNIQYATRVQRDSGNTATAGNYLLQNFESINSIPFAGKTVTLSFYARAGANFSAASSFMEYNLATGTGTDQNLLTGFTGRANPILGNATLTTTWQRFTATATLATSATQIGIAFDTAAWVGTAGANDWFEVTGVQLEVGSVATPFRTYAATIQGELDACMRYYQNQYVSSTRFAMGFSISTTAGKAIAPLPVPMRVPPISMSYGGTIIWYDGIGGASVGTLVAENPSTISCGLAFSGSSGLTASRPIGIAGNSADAYLAFNAEL
jgi:hypothetical protein